MCGRICFVGSVFLRKLPTSNVLASFFMVAEVVASDNDIYLIMENLDTISLNVESFSFNVRATKKFTVISPMSSNGLKMEKGGLIK